MGKACESRDGLIFIHYSIIQQILNNWLRCTFSAPSSVHREGEWQLLAVNGRSATVRLVQTGRPRLARAVYFVTLRIVGHDHVANKRRKAGLQLRSAIVAYTKSLHSLYSRSVPYRNSHI